MICVFLDRRRSQTVVENLIGPVAADLPERRTPMIHAHITLRLLRRILCVSKDISMYTLKIKL